ncbi:MAG: protein phosphatase 2C domain-containing protein [Dysgonamonadaceae bacterium]|jgi:serine/threonine protein phosphatase PrpC|nr:protein phosphatase 2C domain-containing protein [Dysgonamonadaceae bacterium]
MKIHSPLFQYEFQAAALVDMGLKRSSNQDEVITCPKQGFYAVSDGMGGLPNNGGGVTSGIIRQILPMMIENIAAEYQSDPAPENAARLLCEQVQLLSNNIYDTGNKEGFTRFGATLSGVWLVGGSAVFVSLGDSRGYILPFRKRHIRQVTADHNVAALLVEKGEITKAEAHNHPSSSQLFQFAGMPAPARPFISIVDIRRGDCILLCSDGLHGMVDEMHFPRLIRSSRRNPEKICRNLINEANANGGRDNISTVYIKVLNNSIN